MQKILVTLGLLVILAGTAVAQKSDYQIPDVRDPVRLTRYLNTDGAAIEARLGILEALGTGGSLAAGKIVVGNQAGVAAAVDMSGAATITSNGVVSLAGNIPVARMTNAFPTLMPAYASGTFWVVSTTQLVFITTSGAVTNLIDADIAH